MTIRFPKLNVRLRLPRRLTAVSVRARIAALALIPVAGFVANGLTYMSSERDVEAAFMTVKLAGAMSDASRQLKAALVTMRASARDFAVTPSAELAKAFA